MAAPAHNKYYLRSLHEEISLYDRKLAHVLNVESFASEEDRTAAATKLSTKRGQLAKAARGLVAEGIEFNPSELPRSLRTDLDTNAPPSSGAAAV